MHLISALLSITCMCMLLLGFADDVLDLRFILDMFIKKKKKHPDEEDEDEPSSKKKKFDWNETNTDLHSKESSITIFIILKWWQGVTL